MINHPLNTLMKVKANVPACPCTGRKFDMTTGLINQVDKRDNTYWYLINGKWVKEEWVIEVLK